jgi:hypothetical protein
VIDLAAARELVVSRLLAEKEDAFAKPLQDCGTGFDLVCSACKSRRPVVLQCKKRWCPSCARILSADRLDRYQASIDAMKWPLLVTLTMPHSADSSDPSDVRKLRRALGKLRRLRWFKRSVSGGITSIEVTCGDNGWHPHAHMLIDCRWMAVTVPEPDYRTSKDKFKSAFKRARKEVAEQWALCLGETTRLQVA